PNTKFIKISLSKNGNYVYCTNNIVSGIYRINNEKIEIENFGSTLIKNDLLNDIISRLNEDDEIKITKLENSVLSIKSNKISSEINILDFPFPKIDLNENNLFKINLSLNSLNEIYRKNGTCAFNDLRQVKPISGIYFTNELENEKLTTMSTDTFKLSLLENEINTKEKFNCIVPSAAINTIISIFKDEKNVDIYIDQHEKKLIVKNDDLTIIDRTINGEYPKDIFLNAFKINTKTKVVIDRQEIYNSLEMIKSIVKNESNPVVDFDFQQKLIFLNASSFNIGNININIENQNFNGEEIKIRFNVNFLLTLIRNIDSKNIIFEIDDNSKPMLIYGENDHNFKELILPIKINN
ncbi:MAG: DNA polymerase III subunit beta, partial [Ureaplasma sp.]|nr:DNA polymerase III subunit beta [Ureaplasma sp.]